MKTKIVSGLALSCLLVLAAGCVNTLDGHKQAGYPFLKDKIESRYDRPVAQIFAAAKEVLTFNGTLYGENTVAKTLEAKVDTRTVWVLVEESEPNVSRVVVQVRKKGGGSDIDLASEIDKQIALRLK